MPTAAGMDDAAHECEECVRAMQTARDVPAFQGVEVAAAKSGDGRFDVSDCELSLRFNQLEADDALCGTSEGSASGPATASGVPLQLPQPDCEDCSDCSVPTCGMLK